MEKSVVNELAYVQASIGEMETYLLSKELFWPIGGKGPGGGLFPRLTLGGVLIALARLQAMSDSGELSQKQLSQLNKVIQGFGVIQSKWRVAFESKIRRELVSRINQWRNYLDDLEQQLSLHADYYSAEVRVRVIAQLILESIDDHDSHTVELIASLDRRLRRKLNREEFIWELYLKSSFPEDAYWYLYGKPIEV